MPVVPHVKTYVKVSSKVHTISTVWLTLNTSILLIFDMVSALDGSVGGSQVMSSHPGCGRSHSPVLRHCITGDTVSR